MIEEESWGVLTRSQLGEFLGKFTKLFGKPRHSKRLSLSFWDHNRNEIDTRIRITDGKAEIMQKVGDIGESKHRIRSEQKIDLPSDTEEIFNAYQILRALVQGDGSCFIYQYDNYIFDNSDFEIKLTHQIGKTDKYNFEVEIHNKELKLTETLKKLGLFDLVTITDSKFWDKWNEELNLKDIDLSMDEIKDIIKKYL